MEYASLFISFPVLLSQSLQLSVLTFSTSLFPPHIYSFSDDTNAKCEFQITNVRIKIRLCAISMLFLLFTLFVYITHIAV